jgi:NAD(P)-dependent dehydrogenase (short-subunit alcohol dehydrogenase family)
MEQLTGRVAVITGAASGIGLAMAHCFAREGMKLVLADIEPAPLAQAVAALRDAGAVVASAQVDVGDEAQVRALADLAWRTHGAVHLVCNNAGVASPALTTRAWESSIADWDWILRVNLMGVLHGVRAFVPRMLADGQEGHVVNTASVAGLLTGANPYHVSKNGVTCLTEGLYKDLRTIGAKVSTSVLCPGLIRTGILDAERNRPAELGRTQLHEMRDDLQRWAVGFRQALEAGWDPARVAEAVRDAVRADRFYIVPAQDNLQALIRTRMTDIIEQRNPTLPPRV